MRVGIVGGAQQPKDDGDHRAKKISFLIHFYRKALQVCLCCPKIDQNIISIGKVMMNSYVILNVYLCSAFSCFAAFIKM